MQTDTVIGIVGAVVLVAVMVGVFAYEYNNTPDPDDGGDDGRDEEQRMAQFRQQYPHLNATQDIDENGVPNWQEDNITLHVVKQVAGNVAARSGVDAPAHTGNQFTVYQGARGGTVSITWSVTDVGGTAADDLVVSIAGVSCDNSRNGQATCDLTGIEEGTYTIRVEHSGPPAGAQSKSFEGTVELHYD